MDDLGSYSDLNFSQFISRSLRSVPMALITIGLTVTIFMAHLFNYLAKHLYRFCNQMDSVLADHRVKIKEKA